MKKTEILKIENLFECKRESESFVKICNLQYGKICLKQNEKIWQKTESVEEREKRESIKQNSKRKKSVQN